MLAIEWNSPLGLLVGLMISIGIWKQILEEMDKYNRGDKL
jgi:hypothetical protein